MNTEQLPSSTEVPAKLGKPTSQAKIEANRKNALRSTGPKTARGKRAASRNAIKHGLLARNVVNSYQDEKIEDFQKLLGQLIEHYDPVGPMETLLVERIAVSWWRLQRVLVAENAASAKSTLAVGEKILAKKDRFYLDFFTWRAALHEKELGISDRSVPIRERATAGEELLQNLRGTPQGIRFLRDALSRIKADVEVTGTLKEPDCRFIVEAFGAQSINLIDYPNKPLETEDVKRLLAAMTHQLAKLARLEEHTANTYRAESLAEFFLCSLPTDESVDRLLRYETHFERQFYRATEQLERTQRRRRGEWVPAPVKLEIGGT